MFSKAMEKKYPLQRLHLYTIFDMTHFSKAKKKNMLAAYF